MEANTGEGNTGADIRDTYKELKLKQSSEKSATFSEILEIPIRN